MFVILGDHTDRERRLCPSVFVSILEAQLQSAALQEPHEAIKLTARLPAEASLETKRACTVSIDTILTKHTLKYIQIYIYIYTYYDFMCIYLQSRIRS